MGLNVITDRGEHFSKEELRIEMDKFGQQMPERSLIFLLCSNTIGSLIGYLGCLEHRIVPIMLDSTKDLDSLHNLQNVYRPNYVWAPTDAKFVEGDTPIYECQGYGLYKGDSEDANLYKDLGLLLTTSGSTGSPKLVRLSYENVKANAESIAEYLSIDENERPITSLPMYYSYGISVINSHYIKDATLLLTDHPVIQKLFWMFAQDEKATSIAGVPFTYEMLRRLRIFKMDLPYLKTMTQAGGKLNAKLAKEYIENAQATGKRFFVMYGQTEATARMSYLPLDKALEKYASIGVAIPGGRFAILDVNGNEITESDVDGELEYWGKNVSLGYGECREDLQKGDENHGVLKTGDVARRDADGYYYITGRMKRFLKIYGNRVNLDATEQFLKAVTLSVACVGVDDKMTVFITDESKKDAVKDLLMQKTGINTRAFDVRVIDAIPIKSSGKLDYRVLQAQL